MASTSIRWNCPPPTNYFISDIYDVIIHSGGGVRGRGGERRGSEWLWSYPSRVCRYAECVSVLYSKWYHTTQNGPKSNPPVCDPFHPRGTFSFHRIWFWFHIETRPHPQKGQPSPGNALPPPLRGRHQYNWQLWIHKGHTLSLQGADQVPSQQW